MRRQRLSNPSGAVSGNGSKPKTPDQWAFEITATWNKATESIIATGHLLSEAKEALRDTVGHGHFLKWVSEMKAARKLPFGQRAAQMLMNIAQHPILTNPQFIAHLPPSYRVLDFLAGLPESELVTLIEDGKVHPELKFNEAKMLGFHTLDQAFRALCVVMKVCDRTEPAKLAAHWENVQWFFDEMMLSGLKRLPAYLHDLDTELERHFQQSDRCMDGWKPNDKELPDEHADM
jgi:hypothetical protein